MKRLIWNRHTKLVLKHVLGWFLIVTGIIMLVTPGQGLLTLLIGVYLLADHVPMFGRLKTSINQKFPKLAEYVRHASETLKNRFKKKP
ncbi:MAG: PGPGW domain-containing protein [Kiritimatiellales bacterium]|nr:PGPGW domain-containing protein [Kiritimatiellales bacterium]MCF7863378.1 PGPGW domain-containing protein [Kiritimatiellales bacterium]